MKRLINKYLTFIKYVFVAGLSFIIDITLFTIFNVLFKNIILATIIARIISSLINYILNKDHVFLSKERKTIFKYYLLVIIQMLVSATLVNRVYSLITINPTIIKVPVELFLFLLNYFIQKYYIFKTKEIPYIIDNHLKYFFLSFLTTFSIYKYILLYINNHYLEYFLIFIAYIIFLIFYKLLYKNIKLNTLYQCYTIILSFILVLGYSYEITSTGKLVWGSLDNFMLSLIKMVGFYFFFKTLVYYFNKFLKKKYHVKENKLIKEFSHHPFRYSFIFLFLLYGIFSLIYYPGIINYDNANQIKEVLGLHTRYLDAINPISNSTLTNFNPIIHTLLIGLPVKLGLHFHNFNMGLYLATIIQLLIIVTIYSYIISYMVKNKINPLYSLIVLFILGLCPTILFYSVTLVKDTIYTAFLCLFSLKIYDYLKNSNNYQFKDYLIFFIISILVCLFRNNGIYIVIITYLFLLFKKKKEIFILIIALLLFNVSFNNILLPSLGISNTSIREALSIPFQQTARAVKYNPDSITKEDALIISEILDYENMANDYDEDLADPIKNKFNKDYNKEDLIKYFSIWAKGLIKNPLIYVDATINNISGYFNPFENGWKIYFKLNPELPEVGYDYHYLECFKGIRDFLQEGEVWFEISPLGWLTNLAVISWLTILCFLNLINKKRSYVVLLPSILSIIFCILSPMNLYFRYIYPSFMILIVLFPIIKNTTQE